MSVTESFFSAAKQLLLATENLKRLDQKVGALVADVTDINMRLVRVETVLDIARLNQKPPKPRKHRTLQAEQD